MACFEHLKSSLQNIIHGLFALNFFNQHLRASIRQRAVQNNLDKRSIFMLGEILISADWVYIVEESTSQPGPRHANP